MPALLSKSLRDYRRVLIGWSVGISGFFAFYLVIYPNIAADPEVYGPAALNKFPGAMRELMGGLTDFTSGVGYLETLVYQLFGPMLFIVCAATLGNRAVARPEESGTLELTLTLPVDRGRLILERFAALALGLLAVAVVSFLLVWGMATANDMGVAADRILAGHTGIFLMGLFSGALCLAIGAAFGRRGPAAAVVGVVTVAGYAVETIGKDMAAISWLRWVSPFHYYLDGRPLTEGFPVGNYLVLLAATAVLVMTAVLAFDRRDVGV